MSSNVYFTDDVKGLPGFTSKPSRDGSGDEVKVNGISLFNDNGRLYTMFGDESSVMPDELKDYIEEVSFYGTMPETPKRERGIYHHESAEAEVEIDLGSKMRSYRVKITAKKIEDVRTLFRKIKAGSIRPEDSHDGQQNGLSRVELDAELARAQRELEELRNDLFLVGAQLRQQESSFRSACEKNVKFRTFANELRKEQWPWAHKSVVADKIVGILDSFV